MARVALSDIGGLADACKKYKVEKWRRLLENTLVIALQVSCVLKTPFINIKISHRLLSIKLLAKSQVSSVGWHNKGGTAVGASYYEVRRVVAIELEGEYIATTACTHRVT